MSLVGKAVPRIDGLEKVTGTSVYGVDLVAPQVLIGRVWRSPWPHAKLENIDVTRAERLPGVKAVVTGRDFPIHRHGNLIKDSLFIAVDKVRYVGEPVVAVAAVDEDAAEEALELIRGEGQPLAGVFGPE